MLGKADAVAFAATITSIIALAPISMQVFQVCPHYILFYYFYILQKLRI